VLVFARSVILKQFSSDQT